AGLTPARANLVADPGFEGCSGVSAAPSGWTRSSTNFFCQLAPHTGTWDADEGGVSATLSQTITTVPGQVYDFSFWLWGPSTTTNSFSASFDGGTVLDLTNAPPPSYVLEDFTVTAS